VAKVIGIREVMLRPNVRIEDFERFLVEKYLPAWRLPGMRSSVLKGVRGDREGRYLNLIEFDTVETYDRYYPAYGAESEIAERREEETAFIFEEWNSFAFPITTVFTDYVMVGS
jgi:hypothetical protein